MHAAVQTRSTAIRNGRICLMLASGFLMAIAGAQDPPQNLIKHIAAVETAAQQAQANYTYRQSVTLEELDGHGAIAGDYREVRDIIFLPTQQRSGRFLGVPQKRLKHLQLTDEDFPDIREFP